MKNNLKLGLLTVAVGLLVLVSGKAAFGSGAKATSHTPMKGWAQTYEEALSQAAKDKKLVFVDFYTDWCGPCKMMKADVFPTDTAKKALEGFVPLALNAEKFKDLASRFQIRAYPTLLILDEKGNTIVRQEGAADAAGFATWLANGKKFHNELTSMAAAIKAKPNDVDTNLKYANILMELNRGLEAKTFFEKSQSLAGDNKAAKAGASLGLAKIMLGTDATKALKDLEGIIGSYGDQKAGIEAKKILPSFHFSIARQLWMGGKKEKALEKLKEITVKFKGHQIAEFAQKTLDQLGKHKHDHGGDHKGHNHD